MGTIKVASWNAEWMNYWFTPDAEVAAFNEKFLQDSHLNNTAATARRASALIRAIDPDILALEEAPSRREELALFVRDYLSDNGTPRYKLFIGDSGGAQKLAVLYKSGSVTSAALAPSSEIAMLLDSWLADVDGDGLLNDYQFTRVPLVVNFKIAGSKLQVIVQHTKSNFVNNGRAMWNDPLQRQTCVVAALKARRRNSAECMRTRLYVEKVLMADPNARIVILGDLNDGPGMDYFEEFYLTHSVTDILVGSAFKPEMTFRHAQHDLSAARRFSSVFDDFVPTDQKNKKLLLDHILLSPSLSLTNGLRGVPGSGTVCHVECEAQVVNQGRNREDRPSDHRPVMVSLEF